MLWLWLALGALALLALLGGALWIAGSRLSAEHIVSRAVDLPLRPPDVWAIVTDYAAATQWVPHLQRTEMLPQRPGRDVWREHDRGGPAIELETVEATAPHRLVRSIVDERGVFRGRWEYEIADAGEGSRLTITEYGTIANPIIRYLARRWMDPAQYLQRYLQALAQHCRLAAQCSPSPGDPTA
jgi:hypothetical protein